MKIRIKGNSVRLRLSRSEVGTLGAEGYIEERTHFGNATFTYALKNYEGDTLSATFENNKMTMLFPSVNNKEWEETNKVGYEYNMPAGNGKSLFLLVEKDFKCLDETHEDQSDNFDNPLLMRKP